MLAVHIYNGDNVPWQNPWVTAYTRDGREISEAVTEGVEPGDGESGVTNDVILLGTKPSDQLARVEVEAKTPDGDQVADLTP